jgi:hypothetical protein
MVTHIVLFTFNEDNKEENILEAKEMLEALMGRIDGLLSMEVGINFDKAPRAMDLSLISTFNNIEDLNSYAVHSEHLKVIDFIKSVIQYSKVVDYVS